MRICLATADARGIGRLDMDIFIQFFPFDIWLDCVDVERTLLIQGAFRDHGCARIPINHLKLWWISNITRF